MDVREVWGYQIGSSPSGKSIWPNALKHEAVKRLRDGARPGDVAAEIGAHECLVRKWYVADRRARGQIVPARPPAFAEVRIETSADRATPVDGDINQRSAKLHIGSLIVEFPISIAEKDLHKIIRVATGAP